MPKNRRGFPPGVAAASFNADFTTPANAGVIASSNGSDRAMPAPRRKLRRESAGRVETKEAFIGCLGLSLHYGQWARLIC